VRVLGLDRFGPAHDRGSSHGQSRLIRQAYFEHPDYVPLVQHAYALWHDLAERSGQTLLHTIGLLEVGPANGEVVPGVLRAAHEHGLVVEELSAREAMRRWPGFHIADDQAVVFEPTAGWLPVEACIQAALDDAVRAGAHLQTNEAVIKWRPEGQRVIVQTDRGQYEAAGLVIAAGAWAGEVLRDLQLPLTVRRKPQLWFKPRSDVYRVDRGSPAFLFETGDGVFYGFPQVVGPTVKIAEHSGGDLVDDPLNVDRDLKPADVSCVAEFITRSLPQIEPSVVEHRVCMYTLSPDQHFIVDRHPHWQQVAFAAGLSGHGFKFAPVLGEILADLSLSGKTEWPCEFLGLRGRGGLGS
jgi:sarcosine oxidase